MRRWTTVARRLRRNKRRRIQEVAQEDEITVDHGSHIFGRVRKNKVITVPEK